MESHPTALGLLLDYIELVAAAILVLVILFYLLAVGIGPQAQLDPARTIVPAAAKIPLPKPIPPVEIGPASV